MIGALIFTLVAAGAFFIARAFRRRDAEPEPTSNANLEGHPVAYVLFQKEDVRRVLSEHVCRSRGLDPGVYQTRMVTFIQGGSLVHVRIELAPAEEAEVT